MKKIHILFSLCSLLSNAQELPDIIPPSPDAHNFSTYGDIPLNGNSGGFSYSLPLFSLVEKDIPINISLDYYSNGVNLDVLSSIVGIDWNLNAGGVISRIVRDYPDEMAHERWYPETINSSDDYNHIKKAVNTDYNSFDTERDWFSFNVNDISGKFYFDQNLELHISSDSNVKIIFNESLSTFEIIDENGFVYKFGGEGFTEENTSMNCTWFREPIKSAWFLSEIISPLLNRVFFEYNTNYYEYISSLSKSISFEKKCKVIDGLVISEPVMQMQNYDCVTSTKVSSKVLSKIEFSNKFIEFIYKNDRQDVYNNNGKYLDSVYLYSDNNLIEKYKLLYEQVNSVNNSTYSELTSDNTIKNRFYLKEVHKYSASNQDRFSYIFDYYNNELLPCRFSYDKDIFGYYNAGNNSKPFAFPKDDFVYNLATRYSPNQFGANREVNPQTVSYGMLNKITYPTGGYSHIEYEANSDLKSELEFITEKQTISLTKECGLTEEPSLQTYNFISNGSYILFFANALIDTYNCEHDYDSLHDNYSVTIKDLTTNQIIKSVSTDVYLKMDFKGIETIEGHEYEVKLVIDSKFSKLSASLTLYFNGEYKSLEKIIYGGGARVKKIYDIQDGNVEKVKDFFYNELNEYPSQKTTLNKIRAPKYSTKTIYYDKICNAEVNKYTVTSSTLDNLYNGRRQASEYTVITELVKNVNVSNNGAIEQKFIFMPDLHPTLYTANGVIPYLPYSNYGDSYSGKPSEIKYYKANYSNYDLIKQEKFNYNNFSIEELKSSVFMKEYDIPNDYDPTDVSYVVINQYVNVINEYKLVSKKTIEYINTDTITTTSYNYYDNPYHMLMTRNSILNSKNQRFITKYYYPDDIGGIGSLVGGDLEDYELLAINRLKKDDLHQISTLVQVDIYNDWNNNGAGDANELISSQRTNYRDWENGIVLPESIEVLKDVYNETSNNPEPRIRYYNYDENGNPKELSKEDGTHIVYIWGYNKQYPIAKIENATYSEVEQRLSDSTLQTSISTIQTLSDIDTDNCREATCGEQKLRLELDKLREALSDSLVTTYTYDPLIGVTSITDPRGEVIYYEYDGFNRLEYIKDSEGNILSKNEYHYKNQ